MLPYTLLHSLGPFGSTKRATGSRGSLQVQREGFIQTFIISMVGSVAKHDGFDPQCLQDLEEGQNWVRGKGIEPRDFRIHS